jgi:hypothetical protein
MRTTFGGNSLFNDDFSLTWQSFICNGKGWGESYTAERQRGRDRVLLQKGYGIGNILDGWRNIYDSQRSIILVLIKMNI